VVLYLDRLATIRRSSGDNGVEPLQEGREGFQTEGASTVGFQGNS
jgi:hypothetical protein